MYAGMNFVSEKSEKFFTWLFIHHAVSLSYNHRSNEQAESYPMICRKNYDKCEKTYADMYVLVTDKINTNQPLVTKPGCTPI